MTNVLLNVSGTLFMSNIECWRYMEVDDGVIDLIRRFLVILNI